MAGLLDRFRRRGQRGRNQDIKQLIPIDIPDVEHAVPSAAERRFTIRAERHGVDRLLRIAECADLATTNIPDAHRTIRAAGEEPFAIARWGKPVYPALVRLLDSEQIAAV